MAEPRPSSSKEAGTAPEEGPQGFLWRVRNRLHIPAALLALTLARPTPETIAAGSVVLLVGLILRTWAMGCISKREVLCTHGPYAMVRHPLYLGNIIVVVGFLILAKSWLLALVLAPYTMFHYWAVISSEEKWLAVRFGEEWMQYKSRVPLILPRPARAKGAFSWQLAVQNGFWPSCLGVLAAAAVLAAKPYVLALFQHP